MDDVHTVRPYSTQRVLNSGVMCLSVALERLLPRVSLPVSLVWFKPYTYVVIETFQIMN